MKPIAEQTENELVKDHIRLVHKIAKKYYYHNQTIRYSDIVQAGLMGLLKGIRNYKSEKNVKLSAFVYRPICWSIINFVKKESKAIVASELTTHKSVDNNDIALIDLLDGLTYEEQYILTYSVLNRVPDKQLAEELGISKNRVRIIKNRAKDKIIENEIKA
jgi:RNA polymerase sigma factor (sigma-70 family)